jgi:hypothetical protein
MIKDENLEGERDETPQFHFEEYTLSIITSFGLGASLS